MFKYEAQSFWECSNCPTLKFHHLESTPDDMPFGFTVFGPQDRIKIYLNATKLLTRLSSSGTFKEFVLRTYFKELDHTTEAYIPMDEVSRLLKLSFKRYLKECCVEVEDVVNAEYMNTFDSWNKLCDDVLQYTELTCTMPETGSIH